MAHFTDCDNVVWFWFAPFAGLVRQAAQSLQTQSPRLAVRALDRDRTPDKLVPGAVFVLTWQTVAAKSADSRLARQTDRCQKRRQCTAASARR